MPNHPTPQPSGITAEDILKKWVWGYGCKLCGTSGTLANNVKCPDCNGLGIVDWQYDSASRQLFDAMLEIVGEDEVNERGTSTNAQYDNIARNQLRAELRQHLRVFFGQAAPPQAEKGKN